MQKMTNFEKNQKNSNLRKFANIHGIKMLKSIPLPLETRQ